MRNVVLGRLVELYEGGGLRSVLAGVNREVKWRRSRAVVWALKRTSDPPEALTRYIELRRLIRPSNYTDADPLKIIRLGPEDITYYSTDPPYYWGRVSGGDWERVEFTEHPVYRMLRKRFIEERTWEEARNELSQRRPAHERSGSSSDLVRTPQRIDELYAAIDQLGYKTQDQLLTEDSEKTKTRNNDTAHPKMNEIGVCIDRDGEFIWRHVGQHRLSIAKIIGVDELPVQVRSRHRGWQDIRDEVRRAEHEDELSERAQKFLDHPDLGDIARDL